MAKGVAVYDGDLQMFVEPEADFKPNYLEYLKWLVEHKVLQGDTALIAVRVAHEVQL